MQTRRTLLQRSLFGGALWFGGGAASVRHRVEAGGAARKTFPRLPSEDADPWTPFAGFRFTARILTADRTYHFAPEALRFVEAARDNAYAECRGLRWAGGQVSTSDEIGLGILFRIPRPGVVQWLGAGRTLEPIRSIVTVVEELPRGEISPFGAGFFDPGEDEVLLEYPPPPRPRGLAVRSTAFLLRPESGPLVAVYNLDGVVRPKRMLLRPLSVGYRLECANDTLAMRPREAFDTTAWRIAPGETPEEAMAEYLDYLGRVHRLQPFDRRADVPRWALGIALVVNLHGMDGNERVHLDYAAMREALEWIAKRFPPARTLVVLGGWGGPHGRTTPYEAPVARMGGEEGFRAFTTEARRLGFHLAPVFKLDSVPRGKPEFQPLAPAAIVGVDGEPFEGRRFDRNGDLALDGDLVSLNTGDPLWQDFLLARIGPLLDEHHLDALLLDGIETYANDPRFDVFQGIRSFVGRLRENRPELLVAGSGWYDGLLAATPFVQGEMPPPPYDALVLRHALMFSPLSLPAPGSGSTGVDPIGRAPFDEETLGLRRGVLPTLAIVAGTLRDHAALVDRILGEARRRAGI